MSCGYEDCARRNCPGHCLVCGSSATETSAGTRGEPELLCGHTPERCDCGRWFDAADLTMCACGLSLCAECFTDHNEAISDFSPPAGDDPELDEIFGGDSPSPGRAHADAPTGARTPS